MSATLKSTSIVQSFEHRYDAEWVISEVTGLSFKSIKTPTFFPIAGLDLAFCFELWYIFIQYPFESDYKSSSFSLHLVKQLGLDVSPTLKFTVEVKVENANSSPFKEMKSSEMIVNGMDIFKFDIVNTQCIHWSSGYVEIEHYKQLKEAKKLIIKCHMSFRDQPPLTKYVEELKTSHLYQEFSKDLSDIYTNSVSSDIVFKIDEKSLPAHKAILVAHSPVFLKMLTNDFDESINNCIVITDSSYEYFDKFLRCLYSGDIEDKSWPALKELYVLADKYDVQKLKKRSASAIKNCLSIEIVCDVFLLARRYEDENMKEVAKNFAARNIQELVFKEDWEKFIKDYPIICNEVLQTVFSNTQNI